MARDNRRCWHLRFLSDADWGINKDGDYGRLRSGRLLRATSTALPNFFSSATLYFAVMSKRLANSALLMLSRARASARQKGENFPALKLDKCLFLRDFDDLHRRIVNCDWRTGASAARRAFLHPISPQMNGLRN